MFELDNKKNSQAKVIYRRVDKNVKQQQPDHLCHQ
jgi:hypothetical protein